MENGNDPLRFVSQLFEIAVWPFQAAAKFQAQHNPLSDQPYSPMLLLPAMLLFLPLCLLISIVAIVYVFFVALPIIFFSQIVPQIAPKLIGPFLLLIVVLAVAWVTWGVLQGWASFSIGPYELILAGVVIAILLGHQMPRIMRAMFRGFHH